MTVRASWRPDPAAWWVKSWGGWVPERLFPAQVRTVRTGYAYRYIIITLPLHYRYITCLGQVPAPLHYRHITVTLPSHYLLGSGALSVALPLHYRYITC